MLKMCFALVVFVVLFALAGVLFDTYPESAAAGLAGIGMILASAPALAVFLASAIAQKDDE